VVLVVGVPLEVVVVVVEDVLPPSSPQPTARTIAAPTTVFVRIDVIFFS
jgi:hypothetical protein